MSGAATSQARLTLLLIRHLLHVMRRQRARAVVLWAALALSIGIGIGLLAFVTSIEDSFRERGEAVGGVSDVQVEAIGSSSLEAGLAERLEDISGTRYAIPMTQQRITMERKQELIVATAIGVDRSARRLGSAVQRDLGVRGNDDRKPGLALTTALSQELGGVKRGERIQLSAFGHTVEPRVARIVDVNPAIEDVVTLPRKSLELLRGAPGQPTVIYVKLRPGVSTKTWEDRVQDALPGNATIATPQSSQGELSHVLDFTVRAPTFVFGMVVLAIAGLLIYVLQLMRMLERQEDLGLLRALGSGRLPLIVAESIILAGLLAAAVPPGVLIGTPIANYLASQVPTYLTDIFGFNVQVAIRPDVVAIASLLALLAGIAATVGALSSARGSIADQLGRSPQAGATVTSEITLRASLALLGGGAACLALGLIIADLGVFPLAAVIILVGLALSTPGVVGLVTIGLGRLEHGGSTVTLVARGAVEANPRRAALAAAIMALGVAAVIPPQLAEHSLLERTDLLSQTIRPKAQQLLASDDSFATVPITSRFARQALRDPTAPANPTAFAFIPYEGRKIELRALVPNKRHGIIRNGVGLPQQLPKLRAHPKDILISRVMATGFDIETGDSIAVHTAVGQRKLKVVGEVEDFAWPSGTIYMDIDRYRSLYRTDAVNVLAVRRRSSIDTNALKGLKPLHTVSGTEFRGRLEAQMQKSTQGLLAMRVLTLLAALVAVGGIIATSVFARRREWAVLRAMGIRSGGLFAALAVETLLVMTLGGICGAIGGVVSFRGPTLGFLESQGYIVSDGIVATTVFAVVAGAVLIGTVAAALPAWLTARAPLSNALSYE
ncbi:MAG TPA: FtsX-like permease family protein [Solirubrobacterales bacterium]|jgi:putative ABC transport system permease protein